MDVSVLRQVHFGTESLGSKANLHVLEQQHAKFRKSLLGLCPAPLWHHGSYDAGCPRPILVGKHHHWQLEGLHEALTTAICDVVDRWWTDKDAQFPQRMPLEKTEEDLLKWLDVQVVEGNLRPFRECLGSWRPDFLVENHPRRLMDASLGEENFSITEINARFSFNGFMHAAYGQKASSDDLKGMGARADGLVGATNPETILNGLFDLFDPTLPLHLLKGEEKAIDIYMFIDAVQRRFGITPRLIAPDDLRIVPDPRSTTGYQLCCIAQHHVDAPKSQMTATTFIRQGESLEIIHQVGLELHQRELAALKPEILCQLSLRCFNDMRTVLLVHDKRMLGIIRQELRNMVARQVLSVAQAKRLDRGIVETTLAGSRELQTLLQMSRETPTLKNGFIIKPIRSGKGDGIVFGEDLDGEKWVAALERLQTSELTAGSSFVVQRRIIPRVYDLILKPCGTTKRYPLVGTYHVSNGKLLGLGTWRASGGRVVAVSSGGSWICSVMKGSTGGDNGRLDSSKSSKSMGPRL